MKFRALACFAFLLFAMGCGKDKFETKPQIEIKSYNTKEIGNGQTLQIRLKFTDKEGDIGGGRFVYFPQRLNRRPLPPQVPNYDSVRNNIPVFPNETDGELLLTLPWLFLHKSDLENDTIIIRFVAVDRGGNKSDTISSDQLVIRKQ